MSNPFGINDDHRKAIVDAIRGFVHGENDFNNNDDIDLGSFWQWSNRIEQDQASDADWKAVKYIVCLPYTQPEIEHSPIRFAMFVAAMHLANDNGNKWDFPAITKIDACYRILNLIK
jgi:hypothetical protein